MDWLKPPELEDPELSQRAAITHFVLLFCMGLVAVLCVIYVLTPGMLINVVVGPPTWLLVGAMLALLRTGRVDLTGYLLVGSLTGVFTLATFFAGGLEVSLPGLFTMTIVMAGLTISPRAGAFLTVYGTLATIGVFIVGSSEVLTYSDHPKEASRFTTQLLTIITVGVIVTWAVEQLRRSLMEVRTQKAELTGALEQLERSKTYGDQLIHTLAEAVIVTDDAMRVRSANGAALALCGRPATELEGSPLAELLVAPFGEGDTAVQRVDGALKALGSEVPVQVSRSRLIAPDGQARWVHVASDLRSRIATEREKEEAKRSAEEANLAKSRFLANMSHELRTPLNAVIGYSEMLMDELEGSHHEDVERIHTSGRHLLHLINDVLDMSKIEAGHMDVVWEPVDVPELVEEVVQTVKPTADRNQTEVRAEVPNGELVCRSDGQKVKQILLNLVSNAVKFTENGSVRVVVQTEANEVRVDVADTGVGIKPDVLDRLFLPFVQADSSTRRRFGGTGLGLALSRSFATMLGGSIEARSEPGVGSTFTLRLPRDAESATGMASGAVATR